MRLLLVVAMLWLPDYCHGAVGILLDGPGSLAPETDYVFNPGRFDVQGDGVSELVYKAAGALRAIDKSGNEAWLYTLDPSEVCPTCDPDLEYWELWFNEFVETEPGQRDATVSFLYRDPDTWEDWSAVGLVSSTTGTLRQIFAGRRMEACLDLDGDGLWELLLAQSGVGESHWEVWGYGSTSSAGDPGGVTPGLRLLQNHPNPFNPRTTVPFELSQACEVRVEFFSSNGRLVDVMELGQLGRGSHHCEWTAHGDRGRPLPSGSYFYSIVAGGTRQSRKLLLLK
jgi:hypothetical protein